MKNLYLLLFLGFCLSGFGQTVPSYTYLFYQNITDNVDYEWYEYNEYLYNPSNSSFVDMTGPNSFFLNSPRSTFVNYNVPVDLNTNTYRFRLWGYVTFGGELDDFYNVISIQDLLKGSVYKQLRGEAYSVLTPNDLTISNLGTTEVCAGEMLNLVATPGGFHNYVYHWQYSLDGQITWNDVPEKVLNGQNITNTEVSRFSIYDILGQDHKNHFGHIDFRIGYNQDRMLSTNTIQINYSACGPTVSSVSFKGPDCNGDIVKSLAVTFNEKLNSALGEKLASLSVVDINDESKIFMQVDGPISYPDDTKKYTYTSFQQLENGHTYRIKYQAQITNPADASNAIMRGVLDSPSGFNFLYEEPEPLKFKIIKADNPLCTNDLAEVSIDVSGGTGDYKFYVDNVEKKNPTPTKEADGYYHIRGLIPTAVNSIKVTDANSCIEKTL